MKDRIKISNDHSNTELFFDNSSSNLLYVRRIAIHLYYFIQILNSIELVYRITKGKEITRFEIVRFVSRIPLITGMLAEYIGFSGG